jgi:TusE/DsrC/DsvC family sulfur relay protein
MVAWNYTIPVWIAFTPNTLLIVILDKNTRTIYIPGQITWFLMRFPMSLPERDGDGYLTDMSVWSPEVAKAMAAADGVDLNDAKWSQILKAREFFDEFGTVPPIRKFAKYIDMDQKELFSMWMTGPMKPITKYGGLPKPTGCV